MSNFLMKNIDILALYKLLAPAYGFPVDAIPSLLVEGIDNDFYKIQIEESIILIRVSKRDMSDAIYYEIELLDKLGKTEVKVPKIVKTRNLEFFFNTGSIIITCFEYIQHKEWLHDADHKPYLSVVDEAGFTLGKLHAATLELHLKHKSNKTIYSEIERVFNLDHFIQKTYEGGSEFLSELRVYYDFAKKNEDKTLRGVIHNDYAPNNLLFLNNKLQAIIDFNWSCSGPFIKDLGLALALWSLPDNLDAHWNDVFESFLSSYNKSAPEIIENSQYLYRWICFSCLYDASTFFADLGYENGNINRINQNRRYKKFKYFQQFFGLI